MFWRESMKRIGEQNIALVGQKPIKTVNFD